MEISQVESLQLNKMFCTVLVQGRNEQDEIQYVYFAVHLHNLQNLVKDVHETGRFNPKDYNAVVIAWAVGGQPTLKMRQFMQDEFAFGENMITLELSVS